MALALKNQTMPELSPNNLWRALIFSILIHTTGFGGWKVAQYFHFFDNHGLVGLLQRVEQAVAPIKPKNANQAKQAEQPPIELLFNIDASEPSPAAPDKPKFYGPVNNLAANPIKTKESDTPQIDGTQNKIIKTASAKTTEAHPISPSPPDNPSKDDTEKTAKSQPKMDIGDLAMARVKPDPAKDLPKNQTGTDPEIKHKRPRLLRDTAQRSYQGERMAQSGGVGRVALNSSLATKGSIVGDYDSRFVEAVRSHWYTLLENRTSISAGSVKLQFVLHADGRVDQMKLLDENVGDVLELICERAIFYSPYDPWPPEMRKELRSDEREVCFTFYYE